MSIPIKNVILLISKYSKICDSVINYIPDSLKDTMNFIYLDTTKTREIVKGKITEVPSCVVGFTNNQTVLYHGYVETRQFLDGLIDTMKTVQQKINNESVQQNNQQENLIPLSSIRDQQKDPSNIVNRKEEKTSESGLPDVSSVQQLLSQNKTGNEQLNEPFSGTSSPLNIPQNQYYPEEAKKRKNNSKLNISEVLKQGGEIIEEGEKRTRRPQPRE
jgi:hypothetical protein